MRSDDRSHSDNHTQIEPDDEMRKQAREHLRQRQEAGKARHSEAHGGSHKPHSEAHALHTDEHAGRKTDRKSTPSHASSKTTQRTKATGRQAASRPSSRHPSHAAGRQGQNQTQRTLPLAVYSAAEYATSGARYAADTAKTLPRGVLALVAVALVAIIGFAAFQCTRPADEPQPDPVPVVTDVEQTGQDEQAQPEEAPVEFDATPAALDGVPEGEGLQTFALAGNEAPALSQEQSAAIEAAVSAAEESGDVSVVFYDIDTGKGISYDADTAVYGASSFKAPYALYVCQTQVDTGNIGLDDLCQGTSAYDPSSYYNGGAYPLSDLITDAIVYSDNNAFGSLRDAFDFEGYDAWATNLGLDDVLYRADSWYPWYCARTSAKVWTEMYSYLQTNSEAALLLGELTSQTETSFMREALAGTGALVQDKAGWCVDSDPRWNGVCDAGIVTLGDKAYILSIMTGMPDGEESYLLYEGIATAVFAARDTLA